VWQLVAPGIVMDDDRLQPGALDDGRVVAVECDADAQRAAAVQKLARQRDRERAVPGAVRRLGRERQAGFFVVSCPRMAPEGYAALWMLT
jgi:hypothetical protein